MAKSKFFRVAVEGATASDGRTIEKSWIQDMAANYNRETYGARVNLEHVRGVTGNAPFKALGDVLALKAEPVDLQIAGKTESRLALYAQIDPTPDLEALLKDRQKIYTSVEVATNFANTNKAGLVGLAVTDTPASLGTEALQFSVSATDGYAATLKAAIDGRKSNAANLFSAAQETTIELEPAPGAGGDDKVSLSALVAAFAGVFAPKAKEPAAPAKIEASTTPAAFDGAAFTAALTQFGEGMQAQTATAVKAAVEPLTTKVTALETKLATTDGDTRTRTPSTGAQAGQFAAADF